MNLKKAKELLIFELKTYKDIHSPDINEALRLSIEADTFIILSRVTTPGSVPTLLHGETED